MMNLEDDEATFLVVVNQEEQYSIWPSHRPLPAGWLATGQPAKKADCLATIERCWTDLRPKSLREHLETEARRN